MNPKKNEISNYLSLGEEQVSRLMPFSWVKTKTKGQEILA